MTNAEKYEEVFGMKMEFNTCPCIECSNCKVCTDLCSEEKRVKWWNSEYKETKKEINK